MLIYMNKNLWHQNFTTLRICQYQTKKYWRTFYTKYSSLVYETTWNTFWFTSQKKIWIKSTHIKRRFQKNANLSRYKNYQQIYTDWSKEDSKVGCAVISDNHSNMQRIPDDSSIFTAEAIAIDLALDFISTCDTNNKYIIFSDSLSVLKAMNHTSSKNPQIQKLLEKCHELLAYKEIVLCWIPSHIGIQGNDTVDKQAKTSLTLEPTSFKIPFSNFKPSINKCILEEWQTSWNKSIGNKLLDIKTNY